ncbi:hypothetical protein GGX14DRAFT_444977 [Mycena pura]|uniref:Nephrocystin 3-like N-terminal domain-containing protein n=1 Tax=Mycena pura TaxID=153505 RepID=A0AAD6YJ44_9AGAR|nr:hypothetical protein GGX14DRAFT_444977 [Mycena pura]
MDKATSDYTRERASMLAEFLVAEMTDFEALRKRSTFTKILESNEDAKSIEAAMKRISVHLQNFQLDVMTSIERLGLINRMEAVLDKLRRAAASDASHDAGERHPPPQCHPETRMDILAKLHEWSLEDDPTSRILWLHGPAGAGKSAVAQTLCQNLETEGHLGASFFFKRGHSSRGHATKLFPTIAYHLANILPEFKDAIDMCMEKEPTVFDKSLAIQLGKLVVAPLRDITPTRPLVIVLDGLDECEGENLQQEIIQLIGQAVVQSHFPLRFLIASRPESHISQVFQQSTFDGLHRKFNIRQSFDDIRIYLAAEFERIHRDHETMIDVPRPWPSQTVIQHLIDKSSGYFIYAATVIKFIDDQDFRPTERLEIVMGIAEPEHGSPFSVLDQLYTQILEAVPVRPSLLRILSVIAAGLYLLPAKIEQLLGMKSGDVRLTLRRARSVIDVPSHPEDAVIAHHASFQDFLNDQTRSSIFYTGIRSVYYQSLAADVLKAFSYTNDDRSVNAIGHVAWLLDLGIITSAQPSPNLVELLCCVNPDFIFRHALFDSERRRIRRILDWFKEVQPFPPKDLIQLWEDYNFMSLCADIWMEATEKTTTNEEEIHHVVSQISPELIRILHAYPLLYNRALGQHPALDEIRLVLDCSWDELRTVICPLRVSVGEDERALKALFLSVSYRTRIHELHSSPTLGDMAAGAMQVMTNLTTHQLPRGYHATAPVWGCVLRSCPPCPDLLRTLRETESAAAISDPMRPLNKWNVHNVIEWLKTFPEPSWDLITRIQNLLPDSGDERGYSLDEDPESLWVAWKERTGW